MGIGLLLRLSPMENPNAPTIVVLDQEKVTIGRQAAVKMDTSRGKEVSKHHTTIYRRQHQKSEIWIIEDNNSLNGTFVNGKKIHRIILNYGDEIVFGGGSTFLLGDIVESTKLAECRYVFYLAPVPVKFCHNIDLNASLLASDLLETCAICYCPTVASETLPCGHKFCLACIHEWSRACYKGMRPCVCPMCRTPYSASDLTPEEAQKTSDEVKVYSMEPMLRDLGIKSCKEIKKVNIFKKWTPEHKAFFNKMYTCCKDSETRLPIFLHLTKATIFQAFNQEVPALINAINNMDSKPVDNDKNKLILQFLLLLFEKLLPKPEVKQPIFNSRKTNSRYKTFNY